MDTSNIKDFFREELIRSGGEHTFGLYSLEEEVSQIRYYLQTMEEFIERQRRGEIEHLEKQAENLTEEQRSEFWAWYYPVHWDEIFARRLRSSFLISLVLFAETHLKQICRDTAVIVRSALKSSDLKGNMLERSKKFLEVFGKFSNPSSGDWGLITCIYDVRNVFVHHNGNICDYRKLNRLKQFIDENPALSERYNFMGLEKGFCFFCLDKIDAFLEALRHEVRDLCDRVKVFEAK